MTFLRNQNLLRQHCFINGAWVGAASGETFAVTNPASGAPLASVPLCGEAETQSAIDAAQAALGPWKSRPAAERSKILRRWFDLMLAHQEDLAALMTAEQGKPLSEARGEVTYAASFLEWFAEEAKRVYGDIIPSPSPDRRLLVLKEPVGVCAAITPWNFPLAMITRKVGPALAAGCTMVIKPAEQTPLSAFALAELADQAGVPAGVLNVVTGDARAIGGVLTASQIVRKLSFTGSTGVGRLLMAQCAPTVKKLSMELGGNAPLIVFEDADLDLAVAGALASKYRNAGQTCVCTNRFLVHASVMEAFAEKLAAAVAGLTVGDGATDGVTQGPLIDEKAVCKVEELIEDATRSGGQVVCGGKRHALGGTFFEPTVIAHATPSMRIAREEIFGPVAPLFSFTDEAEALRMANDTEFGLAAYFFTRDPARIWRMTEALEYGMVGVNAGLISNEVAPFGGVKNSGIGREGSKYGIEEYLHTKYMCQGALA